MADNNSSLQDDELYLPRSEYNFIVAKCVLLCHINVHTHTAVVNKLIKEIVPNIRVSTDARDLLLNCCTGRL